ncbi:MAG: LytTR family DNA-binding domain-containing protein [Cellvibrio sp.]|uniref:LytTR family DNA-binding domain-containing protein n=1 Tax=Cellvibrio sp. TaxID=1965322 RepID=UPI0031A810C8
MTTNDKQQQRLNHFLAHQKAWGAMLLIGWFCINIVVLATNHLMEYQRMGKSLALWEAFCWEISSCVILLSLIPLGIWLNDRWLARLDFKRWLVAHMLATLPFSLLHVSGMVGLRKLWYFLMDSRYEFGHLPMEFFYEYRKDAQAYLTLALVIAGYRFIVRRLQGEASYLADSAESESAEPESPPERLLIKKLGREFLIQTSDIEWIEASGNYANLHIKDTVYPMRITMDKLEKLLPSNFARIHRSTIVNLEQIREIQALDTGDYQVTLLNQKNLTLSRRYRDGFKSLLSLT